LSAEQRLLFSIRHNAFRIQKLNGNTQIHTPVAPRSALNYHQNDRAVGVAFAELA
jgi:hypothetical protein